VWLSILVKESSELVKLITRIKKGAILPFFCLTAWISGKVDRKAKSKVRYNIIPRIMVEGKGIQKPKPGRNCRQRRQRRQREKREQEYKSTRVHEYKHHHGFSSTAYSLANRHEVSRVIHR
jgi:hypothetical protein